MVLIRIWLSSLSQYIGNLSWRPIFNLKVSYICFYNNQISHFSNKLRWPFLVLKYSIIIIYVYCSSPCILESTHTCGISYWVLVALGIEYWWHQLLSISGTRYWVLVALGIGYWCHQLLSTGVTSHWVLVALGIEYWCHQLLSTGVTRYWVLVALGIEYWCHQLLSINGTRYWVLVSPVNEY